MKKFFLLVVLCIPVLLVAELPRAPCTCFGLLKDSYGNPYLSNARVTFINNEGVTAALYDVSDLVTYGVNFKVSLDMDNGWGDKYAAYAVREGEVLQVVVRVNGVERPLLEGNTLTVPAPGTDIPLSLTTGTDSDADGLPDEWEQQMMAASHGAITNIVQILPDDDFDGDGSSNMHEYLAGTFAFLDYDCFAMENLERYEDGRFIFRFLSVPGRSYSVEISDDLTNAEAWRKGTFSLDSALPSVQADLVGDGYYKTMYIEPDGEKMFMRLIVK